MPTHKLLEEIENKRAELIAIGMKTGLTSALALQYSMELDQLLNQYRRLEVAAGQQDGRYSAPSSGAHTSK